MKILIARFSSIGDIVLTTPVVRCLKTQFPGYQLHYVTKRQFQGVLQTNPYIDKIYYLDNDLHDLIYELKTEKYDFMIDLHNNIRTKMIWSSLKVKRYAFDKINFEKWLMTAFKIDIMPYVHIVDRYMATLKRFGVVNDGKGLDFFIDTTDTIEGFRLPSDYVVFAIGGQHATKRLPLRKMSELINLIKSNVVLLGGKDDFLTGELLERNHSNTINLCGKATINQSAMVIDGAKFVYTHDTGMMHIAAALEKPIVSIWGNTTPRFGMYPYLSNEQSIESSVMLEVDGLSCRPCSKIGFDKCPKGHFKCMEEMDFSILNSPDKKFW